MKLQAPALGQADPYGQPELYGRAQMTRGMIAAFASRCGVGDHARRTDAVDNAWTWIWERLDSRVHAYRYEARFAVWLKWQLRA